MISTDFDEKAQPLIESVDKLARVMGREEWSASANIADAIRGVVDARIDLARAISDVTHRAARLSR